MPVYVPRPGVIERVTHHVLAWVLPAIAVIVALWGANRVFWAWKWSQLSHAVRSRAWSRLGDMKVQASKITDRDLHARCNHV